MFKKICPKCGEQFSTDVRNRKYCDNCKGYHKREYTARKSKFVSNLFKDDSVGLSYFMGFIYADGYYDKNGDKLYFFSSDYDIIQKLHSRMEYTGEIQFHRKDHSRFKDLYRVGLYANNAKFFKDIGFKNNKSQLVLPVFEGFDLYAFLLGYMDGDGSISVKKNGRLNSVVWRGNQRILFQIAEELGYGTPRPDGNIYYLAIGGKRGLDILDKMYKCNISMDRKRRLYKSLIR